VTTSLVATATVVALLLAVVGAASTLAGRRTGLVHLALAGALEVVLLLQGVVVVVAVSDGERPEDSATFASYLVAVLLVPVAGVLWARTERTRWAGTVLAVAGLVVAVMVWRLLQLWEGTGA
jgi:hypothetical protein